MSNPSDINEYNNNEKVLQLLAKVEELVWNPLSITNLETIGTAYYTKKEDIKKAERLAEDSTLTREQLKAPIREQKDALEDEKNRQLKEIEQLKKAIIEKVGCNQVVIKAFYSIKEFSDEELDEIISDYEGYKLVEKNRYYIPFILCNIEYIYTLASVLVLMGIRIPISVKKKQDRQFLDLILDNNIPLIKEEKEAIMKVLQDQGKLYKRIKAETTNLTAGLPKQSELLKFDPRVVVDLINENIQNLRLPISHTDVIITEMDRLSEAIKKGENIITIWEDLETFNKAKKDIEERYEDEKKKIESELKRLLTEYHELKEEQKILIEKISSLTEQDENEIDISELKKKIRQFQMKKNKLERKLLLYKKQINKIPMLEQLLKITEPEEANRFVMKEFGEIIAEEIAENKEKPLEKVEISRMDFDRINIYLIFIPVNVIKIRNDEEKRERIIAVIKSSTATG